MSKEIKKKLHKSKTFNHIPYKPHPQSVLNKSAKKSGPKFGSTEIS